MVLSIAFALTRLLTYLLTYLHAAYNSQNRAASCA